MNKFLKCTAALFVEKAPPPLMRRASVSRSQQLSDSFAAMRFRHLPAPRT